MTALGAADLGVPELFNAATFFIDRNVEAGRGSHVAIECGDRRITYSDLLRGVNRAGSALRRLGVQPEERIVLLLVDGPEFAYSFFGAIKAGAVPIPLNTMWKVADYRHVLRDSRAAALVVSEELLPAIEPLVAEPGMSVRHVIVAGSGGATPADAAFAEFLSSGSDDCPPEPTHRDSPAFWLYSSGSTGAPKGCVHLQHDMVVCATLFAKGILGIAPTDRCYSVAKLFFAYGLGNALYFPFSVGATTILWPAAPTPANVFPLIERHRPTLFFSVPTGYAMLMAYGKPAGDDRADYDLSSIRLAVSAGEALPAAIYSRFKQRYGIDIIDGIGSTEALHMFISNRPGAIRPGSSGNVVAGYEARIVDDAGLPVSPGEIGNLWIRGDSTCASYWNQHEKSKDTIEGHWLRTGDKYSVDDDGFYWYQGRVDDMLKIGGQWVSPIEVENTLVAHPAVLECGVIGRQDHDGLVKSMAFVVLRSADAASPELAKELQQFVRTNLAAYKRPQWVQFIDELPKTATGKIQRFRLRELGSKR